MPRYPRRAPSGDDLGVVDVPPPPTGGGRPVIVSPPVVIRASARGRFIPWVLVGAVLGLLEQRLRRG